MKSLYRKLVLTTFSFVLLFGVNIAQEWHWDWGSSITGKTDGCRIDVLATDLNNNIYCRALYNDSIFFPDTSFTHPTYPYEWNTSFAKYNFRGEFINGIDIYSTQSLSLFNPLIIVDSSLNMFIATDFRLKLHLQDSIFYLDPSTAGGNPDINIIKLNPEMQIEWSGLIHSYTGDGLTEILISEDNYIYIACEHQGFGIEPIRVSFFDQDTSSYFSLKTNTIVKIDLYGNLIWFKEIKSLNAHTYGRGLSIEQNDLLYFFGHSDADVIVDDHTLIHPYPEQYIPAKFYIAFNSNGEVEGAGFFNNDIYIYEFRVNHLNEFYITGSIYDTIVISDDTIIVPEGLSYSVLIKYDSLFQPIWYEIIPKEDNQLFGVSQLLLDNDNLLFMATGNKDVHIADTVLSLGYYNEVIVGEFDSNGQLLSLKALESSYKSMSFSIEMDNCNNPIIAGNFRDQIIFDKDTLYSFDSDFADGFIAKLRRNELPVIDIGSDSLYCEEYTLFGPEGYYYYSWNDSISNQNWHTIHESQNIHFACANLEGCWLYDTVNIDIHPGLEIYLGPDTTIRENDTITFSIPDDYESYNWSDSSTSNKFTLVGSHYGIGTFPIWVEVTDSPCTESDTLLLTIKSEFGVQEIGNQLIDVYPNPFTDNFSIGINPEFQAIEIRDLNGLIKFSKEINQPNNNTIQIEAENLTQGIYILTITTSDKKLIKKIIKI